MSTNEHHPLAYAYSDYFIQFYLDMPSHVRVKHAFTLGQSDRMRQWWGHICSQHKPDVSRGYRSRFDDFADIPFGPEPVSIKWYEKWYDVYHFGFQEMTIDEYQQVVHLVHRSIRK